MRKLGPSKNLMKLWTRPVGQNTRPSIARTTPLIRDVTRMLERDACSAFKSTAARWITYTTSSNESDIA
ncbi:unnamed protein product [Alternaria alternata]